MGLPTDLNWMDATVSLAEFNNLETTMRLLFSNYPVLAFVVIIVSLMAVADMNWPTHMGDRGTTIEMALKAAGL